MENEDHEVSGDRCRWSGNRRLWVIGLNTGKRLGNSFALQYRYRECLSIDSKILYLLVFWFFGYIFLYCNLHYNKFLIYYIFYCCTSFTLESILEKLEGRVQLRYSISRKVSGIKFLSDVWSTYVVDRNECSASKAEGGSLLVIKWSCV